MTDQTKEEITIILELLKLNLIKNGVSIGFDNTNDSLCFFDTQTFIDNNKFEGLKVSIHDLVK